MNFIQKYKKEVSSLFEDKYVIKLKTEGKLGIFEDDESIFSKHIVYISRLSCGREIILSTSINTDKMQNFISQCTMTEFPSCCGMALLHDFRIRKGYYTEYHRFSQMTSESFNKFVSLNLELVESCLHTMGYSSYCFILSDRENTDLYNAITAIGLSPISEFRNRRNGYLHTCFTYQTNLKQVSKEEEFQISTEYCNEVEKAKSFG